jgi:hypothetical protein
MHMQFYACCWLLSTPKSSAPISQVRQTVILSLRAWQQWLCVHLTTPLQSIFTKQSFRGFPIQAVGQSVSGRVPGTKDPC